MQTNYAAPYALPRIGLYFAIDDILATSDASKDGSENFYVREGLFLTAIKTHYLAPGAIELIRWALSEPRIDVHFFSGGDAERNEVFVQALFKRAFPDLLVRENCLKSVRILSRDDLTAGDDQWNLTKEFGISWGRKKKILPEPREGEARLENTILINDEANYITYHQALNLLYAPYFDSLHLDELTDPSNDRRAETKQKVNRIFFIAGVIQELLNNVSETYTARDYIKAHQYQPNENHPGWLTFNYDFSKDQTVYETGLTVLRAQSWGLSFLTPERFREIASPPLTQEENQLATALRKNEADGCSIM